MIRGIYPHRLYARFTPKNLCSHETQVYNGYSTGCITDMNTRGQSGLQHRLYIIRLNIIPNVETQVPPSTVNASGLHCDLHADIGCA